MTRHFFALLALITGLAAFGSPAAVAAAPALAEALACDAGMAEPAGQEAAGGEIARAASAPATIREARQHAALPARSGTPAALRLPVLIGIERAHE
jgi:hypothetical protein